MRTFRASRLHRHLLALAIGLAIGGAMAVSPSSSRPAQALLPRCGIQAGLECIYLTLQGDGTGGVTFTSYAFPGGTAQPLTFATCSRQGNITGPSSACVVAITFTNQASVTLTMQVMVNSDSCFSYQGGSCGAAVNESRSFPLSIATPTISDTDFSFTLQHPEKMTIHIQGTGAGTVKSSPQGINCPSTCTVDFAQGTTVTLTETPTGNSVFAGWGQSCFGTGLGSPSCNWTINGTLDISPTFNSPTPPPPTPSPTPAPTPTRKPTPPPTTPPTLKPGATPTPRPTSGPANPPTSAATTGPASSDAAGPTPEPTSAPGQTAAGPIAGAPSLSPLDTAAPDVGQTTSSDLSRPLLAGGLVVLLVGLSGGALFFFRKGRGVAPGP